MRLPISYESQVRAVRGGKKAVIKGNGAAKKDSREASKNQKFG